jgi:hypothetical protein
LDLVLRLVKQGANVNRQGKFSSCSALHSAAAAGATSVVLNQAATFTLNSGDYTSTVVFTQYPELLIKLQFGLHGYYSATGVA